MNKALTLLLILTVSLLACTLFSREPAPATATVTATVTVPSALTVRHVAGRTQKICQLTGDLDR